VGRATARKLRTFGIRTIGELATTPVDYLQSWFGKWGLLLHCFANGMDSSPVAKIGEESVIKSIGNSTTTPRDLICEEDCSVVYWMLCESVAARLREGGFRCSTVQISLRSSDLMCFERQMKLPEPSCLASELHGAAMRLLRENYRWARPLRSIGVRGTELVPESAPEQLSLFGDGEKRERCLRLEKTMDALRARYGHTALSRAAVLCDPTLTNIDAKNDHTIHPVGWLKAGQSVG
jgi:DNA polymerase-4